MAKKPKPAKSGKAARRSKAAKQSKPKRGKAAKDTGQLQLFDAPAADTVKAWARLVRASQTVMSAIEAELKAEGFPSLAWYDALLELKRAGEAGLRPFELQHRLLLAQYNLSRLADRMAARGLVEKRLCPDDARGHELAITAAGRTLVDRMWPVYAKAIDRHFGAKLEDDQTRQLAALLGRVMQPAG